MAKKGGSRFVVLAALAANLGIAAAKYVAAALTGSSSMLTEGVHSTVDSMNEVLLLWGEHRAKRPPDHDAPFGYGREIYFWSFVVALMIFGVGAGVSIYEGYEHIAHPSPLESATVNYVVLAISFVLEGASWRISLKRFNGERGGDGFWRSLKQSKDPNIFIVLLEDSAALIGLIFAAIGVTASHALNDPRLDGYASIAIGILLAVVATFLARESKQLLIGERADPAVVACVRQVMGRFDEVTAVNHVRTIHTAPDRVFVAISADFDDALTMGEGERLIERMEAALRDAEPKLVSIYIRPERHEDAAKPEDFDGQSHPKA
jgi:cation diffusion facilitator family transporter